jgi:hypothetical protein
VKGESERRKPGNLHYWSFHLWEIGETEREILVLFGQ